MKGDKSVPRHLKSSDLRLVISSLYRVVGDATTMKDDDIMQIELCELDRYINEEVDKDKKRTKIDILNFVVEERWPSRRRFPMNPGSALK